MYRGTELPEEFEQEGDYAIVRIYDPDMTLDEKLVKKLYSDNVLRNGQYISFYYLLTFGSDFLEEENREGFRKIIRQLLDEDYPLELYTGGDDEDGYGIFIEGSYLG